MDRFPSASSLDPSKLPSQTGSISDQPFCHNALDIQTHTAQPNRWLEECSMTMGHFCSIDSDMRPNNNKKHLKNVGPIHHNEPPHANSPDVASGTVARRLRIDVHDNDDNAWQRGPLGPHGMGPTISRLDLMQNTELSNILFFLRFSPQLRYTNAQQTAMSLASAWIVHATA